MLNIVEVNCPTPDCEGTVTLEYEVEEADRSIGLRGGVSLLGIDCVNDPCECDHPILYHGEEPTLLGTHAASGSIFKAFGKDQIARWEDDALDDLIERGSAG